jgi:hypothetical protein
MFIFNHNSFSRDPLNLRTERLRAIKEYIEARAAELSIPAEMVAYALGMLDLWLAALGKTSVEIGQSEEAHQTMMEKDALTFDYYIRCKELAKDRYGFDDKALTIYGIKGAFPKSRKDKLRAVQNFLDGNKELTDDGDPNVLPAAFIDKFKGYLGESNAAFSSYVLKEKPEALNAVDQQTILFDSDTKFLRTLYSWVLMTWTPQNPFLLQLGFAIRKPKPCSGQPGQVTGEAVDYVAPDLKINWDAAATATGYQLAWSADNEDWEELYFGADISYEYTPPSGLQYYKVRARNVHGYGDWSDIISYDVPV